MHHLVLVWLFFTFLVVVGVHIALVHPQSTGHGTNVTHLVGPSPPFTILNSILHWRRPPTIQEMCH